AGLRLDQLADLVHRPKPSQRPSQMLEQRLCRTLEDSHQATVARQRGTHVGPELLVSGLGVALALSLLALSDVAQDQLVAAVAKQRHADIDGHKTAVLATHIALLAELTVRRELSLGLKGRSARVGLEHVVLVQV